MFQKPNQFVAQKFEKNYTGFIIKKLIKEYLWKFKIGQKQCVLKLIISKFSGNYKVILNNKVIYRNSIYLNKDIDLQFKIRKIQFDLFKRKNEYLLIIDSCLFEKYYIQNAMQTIDDIQIQYNNVTESFKRKPTIVRSSSLDKRFLDNIASNSLFNDIGSQKLNMLQESQFSKVDSDCSSDMYISNGLIVSQRKIEKFLDKEKIDTQMFKNFENSEINFVTTDFKTNKNMQNQMRNFYKQSSRNFNQFVNQKSIYIIMSDNNQNNLQQTINQILLGNAKFSSHITDEKEYMAKHVYPILTQGINQLVQKRPENPKEFLAYYLLSKNEMKENEDDN